MKLFEAEQYLIEKMYGIYEKNEALNIASLVIEHICCLTKNDQVIKKNVELDPIQTAGINTVAQRLSKHEPIQYIMNKTWFYNLELYVDRNVLIPRPETEELVDWVVQDVKSSGKNVFENKPGSSD